MQLCLVEFCTVRAVHKFRFWLVIKKDAEMATSGKKSLMFLIGSIRLSSTVANFEGLYPCSEGQLHSLEERTLSLSNIAAILWLLTTVDCYVMIKQR